MHRNPAPVSDDSLAQSDDSPTAPAADKPPHEDQDADDQESDALRKTRAELEDLDDLDV